jgi:hypothetical protein
MDDRPALGHAEVAARLSAQRDEFRRELSASLQASAAMHGVAYLPGSAQLGDFDPTSTTIAFAPHGDTRDLPSASVSILSPTSAMPIMRSYSLPAFRPRGSTVPVSASEICAPLTAC